MRKFFYFAVISIFITSCSAPAENVEINKQVAVANTTIVSNKSIVEVANQLPTNTEAAVNANKIVIGDASISLKNARKWEEKPGGKAADNTPIAENIGKLVTPAPDDSEVSSQMTAKGQPVETRVFKSHPQLAKIERLYVTMDQPTMTVYLKNGKKVVVPNGKIGNPLTASADAILNAAGQN